MEDTDKYTLGTNYVLRKNTRGSFELFNTIRSKKYIITTELYLLLKLFKYNAIRKTDFIEYLLQNGVNIDINKFYKFLEQEEFSDLLICSDIPYKNSNKEIVINELLPDFVLNTPQRVDLILTERCNLECKHCFQKSTPRHKSVFPSLDILKKLSDELEDMDIKNLKISGGEPLLYPEINDFFEYLGNKKFQKTILTNALLFNSKLINTIKNHKDFRFGISLDGSTKETHEFLRGKYTFDRTINNLMKLRDNNIYFSITITIHRNNIYQIEDFVDFVFNKLCVRVINVNTLEALGRGQENFSIATSLDEQKRLTDKLKEIALKYPQKVINYNEKVDFLSEEENKDESIHCAAGTRFFALNELLEVYPCTYGFGMEEFKMGKFGDETLMNIWNSKKWSSFRGDVKLQDLSECSKCQFKYKCENKNCRLKPIYQGGTFYSANKPCAAYTTLKD